MTTVQKPRLLDQIRLACRVRHDSLRTEQAYVDWARRYILFHQKRHPREMAAAEINAFLTHLAVEGHVAASTQNQAFAALLFLYLKVLEVQPGLIEGVILIVRRREYRRHDSLRDAVETAAAFGASSVLSLNESLHLGLYDVGRSLRCLVLVAADKGRWAVRSKG